MEIFENKNIAFGLMISYSLEDSFAVVSKFEYLYGIFWKNKKEVVNFIDLEI